MRLEPETDPLPRQLALIYAALAAAGAAALRWRGEDILRFARCPWRDLTGWPCPSCGATHAAHALARLDLAAAWRANPLVALAAGGLAVWFLAALAATLRPAWRRRVALAPAERRALGWGALLAVLGTWAYEVVRLR